ncbi:MAG: hypothetical protein JW861_00080 [Bacteroidales bacterium]|nr:hypothetical protein [Bacteroidales bacterium]
MADILKWAAGLAIMLIIGLVYRRLLILKIYRILFGPFSAQYVLKFRKTLNSNPYPYCIRENVLTGCHAFYVPNISAKRFHTQDEIVFEKISPGTHFNQVQKYRGKPRCFNIQKAGHAIISVAGFDKEICGRNGKALLFFLKDKFIMGEYIIEPSDDHITRKISEAIRREHKTTMTGDCDHFYITDDNGNSIYFHENGFSLSIKYYFDSPEIRLMLDQKTEDR